MPETDDFDDDEAALIEAFLHAPDGPAALEGIAALGKARVGLSHLWDATEHPYARFRAGAYAAMANFSVAAAEGSAPFVLRGLKDSNSFVTSEAARAASSLEITEAAPALRALMSADNRFVRSAACLALGRVGEAEDFEALAEVISTDSDTRVVERAARAIGQLGGRIDPPSDIVKGLPQIFDVLGALPTPGRWTATRGLLGILRNVTLTTELEHRLLTMLSADAGVRGDAARVLGRHRVERARSLIESHLPAEPSPRLRGELLRALQLLGAAPSLDVLVQLADSPLDTATACDLLSVLGDVDHPAAHASILKLATGADVGARRAALELLDATHPLRLDLAIAGLADPAVPVRISAAHALADRPDLTDPLETALNHEAVTEVRDALQEALAAAQLAPPPATPYRPALIDSALLALVPHIDGRAGDALRTLILDVLAAGGAADDVADALDDLAGKAGEAAAAYRSPP